MPNPWDVPPLAIIGDANAELTYVGVGRTMTLWESVEFNLARLYSAFVGDADGESIEDYGKGRIFRDRLDGLKQVANRYFVGRPCQRLEGLFDQVTYVSEGFADRRNDVAHGVVFGIHSLDFFKHRMPPAEQSREHFALIPPLQTIRRYDKQGMPKYAYSSIELRTLSDYLARLQLDVDDYRLALLGLPSPLSR